MQRAACLEIYTIMLKNSLHNHAFYVFAPACMADIVSERRND